MDSFKYSETESKRFNKQIYRGAVEQFDIDVFQSFYATNDPDILIFRIPVAEQHKLHELNLLHKEVINADTLVYYEVDLNNTIYKETRNKDLVFITADRSKKDVLASLVPEIFRNYTTHYFSNPLLDKVKITEGYTEWAVNSIDVPDNLHLVVYKNDLPVGFITCRYNNTFAEIVLNGVLPAYQKTGIYTDMIRYVKEHFRKQNIAMIMVSTQIQNFPVQRAWNKEGFVLSSAYVTIHLNKK